MRSYRTFTSIRVTARAWRCAFRDLPQKSDARHHRQSVASPGSFVSARRKHRSHDAELRRTMHRIHTALRLLPVATVAFLLTACNGGTGGVSAVPSTANNFVNLHRHASSSK